MTKVDLDPPLTPGTYDLLVRFAYKELSQALTLEVVIPPASLRALQTVHVEITERWPFGDNVTEAELVLSERSDRSQVSDLSIVSLDARSNDGTASPGRLLAKGTTPAIEPGKTESVELEPVGEYDLGKSTGTLVVDAPQLESPIEATFDVVRRTDPLSILLWALLGLLLGRATLAWLGRYIDRGEALDGLFLLETRLRSELAQPIDKTLRDGLRTSIGALDEASKMNKATDITERTGQIATQVKEALADYDGRIKGASEGLARFRRLFDDPRAMPQFATNIRAELAAGIETTTAHLKAGQADVAIDEIDRLEAEAERQLSKAFLDWARMQADNVAAIQTIRLSSADLGDRDDLLNAVRASLILPKDQPTPAELLDAVVEAVNRLRELPRWLLGLERTAVQAANILMGAPQSSTPETRELQAAIAELASAREEAARLPETFTPTLADAGARLGAALLPAILSVAPENARVEVVTTFEEKGARAAAVIAHSHKEAALGGRGRAVATREELLPLPRETPAFAPTVRPTMAEHVILRLSARDSIAIRQHRVRRATRAASTIRFVLLIAAVLALSFFLFSADWTGTAADVAKVFFWAWGLDLAAESVFGQADKFGSAPRAV